MKSMMLIIILQMVNSLNTKKIVGKTPERPERPPQPPQNPDGTQPPRPPQPAVPALNAEVTVPLKCLSNFWRFPDLQMINCEIGLDLS